MDHSRLEAVIVQERSPVHQIRATHLVLSPIVILTTPQVFRPLSGIVGSSSALPLVSLSSWLFSLLSLLPAARGCEDVKPNIPRCRSRKRSRRKRSRWHISDMMRCKHVDLVWPGHDIYHPSFSSLLLVFVFLLMFLTNSYLRVYYWVKHIWYIMLEIIFIQDEDNVSALRLT